MGEIMLVLLVVSCVMAIKYYFFDMPRKDKLLYMLDAIGDDITDSLRAGEIVAGSDECHMLLRILENEHQMVKKGVTYRCVVSIFSTEISQYARDKTYKTIHRLSQNEHCEAIYMKLESFLLKHIVPTIIRKLQVLLFLSKTLSFFRNFDLFRSFQDSVTTIRKLGFNNSRELRNADDEVSEVLCAKFS